MFKAQQRIISIIISCYTMDSSIDRSASVHEGSAFDGVPSEVQDAVLKKSIFNKQLSIPVKG